MLQLNPMIKIERIEKTTKVLNENLKVIEEIILLKEVKREKMDAHLLFAKADNFYSLSVNSFFAPYS